MTKPKVNGDEHSPMSLDTEEQRKMRARVFKLKQWIINIENNSNKTPQLIAKLDEFYNELNDLQRKRGGFTNNTVDTIMKTVESRKPYRTY